MAKKGILVLMMLALVMLVGCEEGGNGAISPLDVHNITGEWGRRTAAEPGISFLLNEEEDALEMMDIVLSDDPREGYVVTVTNTNANRIYGTYHNDSDAENPVYSISLELFYQNPELTVKISGDGPLAGKTYVVLPTSSS
jgi:hypothetical protein